MDFVIRVAMSLIRNQKKFKDRVMCIAISFDMYYLSFMNTRLARWQVNSIEIGTALAYHELNLAS